MRLAVPIFLVALMASPVRAHESGFSVGSTVGWMSGHWVQEGDSRWTEEHWLEPRGEVMLGVNRSGNDDGTTGFEYLRIERHEDGSLILYASPGGGETTAFRLVAVDAMSATFENPEHDFPTRIRYTRDGDTLHAEISGPGGADPIRWTFSRVP